MILMVMEITSRRLFRFIYPTQSSGEEGRKTLHKFAQAIAEPLQVDDLMGVMEDDGTLRGFTSEEKGTLGIRMIGSTPDAEESFWEKMKAESGQEKLLLNKDKDYPLRERFFTDAEKAKNFEIYLENEVRLPYIFFGPPLVSP
jgi:hypothetical protein